MHWIQSELEAKGYRLQQYSGRGMMGRQCLGVLLDGNDGYEIMAMLGAASDGQQVPIPKNDSLGRGYILYWPHIEYTEET